MSNLKQIECFTLAEWLKNDKLVLLTGAGISVSAGLQPFRVNNRSLNKGNLSALEFYSNGDPMRVFNHVAKMSKQLIRNYSMNIDCLENEVRTRSLDGFYTDLSSLTIRLHGEVLKAICFRCSKVYELTDTILKSWKSSDSSGLINCEDSQCLCRPRDSKLRQLKVNPAKLRPHIVLYDEELPINAQERYVLIYRCERPTNDHFTF
ncbi:DHS-like NAD/FAD-binding domain-containing protein [Globomyces pollinis-pini]|nr:DHS-like NAD/FAD-binding domain-containing protein [Globomyces pollinis-pini]